MQRIAIGVPGIGYTVDGLLGWDVARQRDDIADCKQAGRGLSIDENSSLASRHQTDLVVTTLFLQKPRAQLRLVSAFTKVIVLSRWDEKSAKVSVMNS